MKWNRFLQSGMAVALALTLCAPTEAGAAVKSSELVNPHIPVAGGRMVWDCIYFGNYWQSGYTPEQSAGNGDDTVCDGRCKSRPEEIPRYGA